MFQDWLSDAEALKTMKKYDVNGSGDISFDEFAHLVEALHFFLTYIVG